MQYKHLHTNITYRKYVHGVLVERKKSIPLIVLQGHSSSSSKINCRNALKINACN